MIKKYLHKAQQHKWLVIFNVFIILGLIFLLISTYKFFTFNTWDLVFHVPDLQRADKSKLKKEDLEALDRIVYEPVSLSQIPQSCQDAFVAIEDKTFWTNDGIDLRGVGRMMLSTLPFTDYGGGSTISQQVIKLSRDKFYDRGPIDKYIEMLYSIRLNKITSKEQILEMYLNNAYFGDYNYGIQAAAKMYYQKDVSELSLEECAYLAGIPQLPNAYKPTDGKFPEAGIERQKLVIKLMKQLDNQDDDG